MGGSITRAHGVYKAEKYRYSSQLEEWMNNDFPSVTPHRVFNLGTHGADICALSKRINLVLEDLETKEKAHPSLFILEFGVNDYQGLYSYSLLMLTSQFIPYEGILFILR